MRRSSMRLVRIIGLVVLVTFIVSTSALCAKETGSTAEKTGAGEERATAEEATILEREQASRQETLGERFLRETRLTLEGAPADRSLKRPVRPDEFKSYPGAKRVPLPKPEYEGLSVEKAMALRHSVRDYSESPITIGQLSQLLFSAQGMTGSTGPYAKRTAPSAGALYPFEVYVVATRVQGLPNGIYHYAPRDHALELVKAGDFGEKIMTAGLSQGSLGDAAAVIVLTAVFDRTRSKYGERGFRYVFMEAGHIAQNLCLEVASLGLGSVTVGAFFDEEVDKLIGIDGVKEATIYLHPVGAIR
jgi:SagB-type dehydrogenase family enzyme